VTPASVFAGKFNSFIGNYSGIAAAGGFAHLVWKNGGFVNLHTHLQTATLTLPWPPAKLSRPPGPGQPRVNASAREMHVARGYLVCYCFSFTS
jgi:hypothetical protein